MHACSPRTEFWGAAPLVRLISCAADWLARGLRLGCLPPMYVYIVTDTVLCMMTPVAGGSNKDGPQGLGTLVRMRIALVQLVRCEDNALVAGAVMDPSNAGQTQTREARRRLVLLLLQPHHNLHCNDGARGMMVGP